MTQILTLQPTATVPGYPDFPGTSLGGGAATYHAAVNDNSDATYIEAPNTVGGLIAFQFADPALSLPATGYVIENISFRLRRSSDAAAVAAGQLNPWWWHSYIANGDGFGAPSHTHGKTLSIADTTNLAANTSIQDGWTTQVAYMDSGSPVRSMKWANDMQIFFGIFPTGAGTVRLYKVEMDVRYNSLPVATIGANPADPSNSTRPIVGWTYADADLSPQQSFRVIIVRENVPSTLFPYGTPGHDLYRPDGATEIAWDSGEWFGSGNQIQVGPGLVNGQTYYAHVRVQTTPVAGVPQYSRWGWKKFTITATGPADPIITVTAEPANARNHIVVRESTTATPHPVRYTLERVYDPLTLFEAVRGGTYTAKARGFRTPAAGIFSGWYTEDDASLVFTNGMTVRWRGVLADYTYTAEQNLVTQALQTGNLRSWIFRVRTDGKLEFTWSTAGTSFNITATSTVAAGATDGQEAVFEARVIANTNPWSVQFWRSLDGGQTWLQVGTTVTGAGPQTLFNSTHRVAVSGYDNFLWGQLNGLTAEVHIWNAAGVLVANPSFEGQPPKTTEFIDPVGQIWTFNGGSAGYLEMELDIYDYEAPTGIPVWYEVQAWRDDTDIVAGDWVGPTPATVTLPGDVWHLKDPLDPANNLVVKVAAIDEKIGKPMTIADPLATTFPGRPRRAVVAHTGTRGSTFGIMIRTLDKATFDQLLALWRSGRTLLLQNVHGRQWYVQPGELAPEILKSTPTAGEGFVIRHAYELTTTLTEVEPPADLTAGTF